MQMIDKLKNFWHYATTRSGRTIATLECENYKLREQLVARIMDETFVTGLALDGDNINLGFKGGAAQLLAELLAKQIEDTAAINYLELSFKSKQVNPGNSYIVTIQKCNGKTPHQLRIEAESELAKYKESEK